MKLLTKLRYRCALMGIIFVAVYLLGICLCIKYLATHELGPMHFVWGFGVFCPPLLFLLILKTGVEALFKAVPEKKEKKPKPEKEKKEKVVELAPPPTLEERLAGIESAYERKKEIAARLHDRSLADRVLEDAEDDYRRAVREVLR